MERRKRKRETERNVVMVQSENRAKGMTSKDAVITMVIGGDEDDDGSVVKQ